MQRAQRMSLSDTHNRISRRRQSKLVRAARGELRAWGKAEDAPAADIALYDAMRTLTHTSDISALFVLLGKQHHDYQIRSSCITLLYRTLCISQHSFYATSKAFSRSNALTRFFIMFGAYITLIIHAPKEHESSSRPTERIRSKVRKCSRREFCSFEISAGFFFVPVNEFKYISDNAVKHIYSLVDFLLCVNTLTL